MSDQSIFKTKEEEDQWLKDNIHRYTAHRLWSADSGCIYFDGKCECKSIEECRYGKTDTVP